VKEGEILPDLVGRKGKGGGGGCSRVEGTVDTKNRLAIFVFFILFEA